MTSLVASKVFKRGTKDLGGAVCTVALIHAPNFLMMLDGPDIYDLIGNSFRMRLICFKQQEMVSWVLPFDALLQENFPQFVSETLFFLGTSGTDK